MFLEGLHDSPLQFEGNGNLRARLAKIQRRIGDVPAHGFGRCGADDRILTGESVVHQNSETVYVGTGVEPISEDLLRTHECRGAQYLSIKRELFGFAAGFIDIFGDAKINQFYKFGVPGGLQYDDVFGFDVSMQYALGMRMVECASHLLKDLDRALDRQSAIACQQVLEVVAFDVIHDKIRCLVLRDAKIVNGDDIGMAHAACCLCFALKPQKIGFVGLAKENLDGYGLFHFEMVSLVDYA